MSTINELKWTTLTPAINEIKSPNQFLKKRFFTNHQPMSTEDIELSVLLKGRECAPFIRKNASAVMVGGHSAKYQTVSAPNIRIKKPFTPSELFFTRRPGTAIELPQNGGTQITPIMQHIARDLGGMADMMTNTDEWLCAMAIRGTITYSQEDKDVFQITFPKPAGNNITPGIFWDDATPANIPIEEHFRSVKKVFNDEVGLVPTDAIMGSEAAAEFLGVLKAQGLQNNATVWNPGKADLEANYNADGVLYLGRFCGIDCWEYSREASLDGVSTPMIRAKYVEFLSTNAASERVLYYGAIADMKVLQGRLLKTERFSKSWEEEDPSVWIALAASRPLPVPRRPGAMVSFKAVSG